MLMFFDQVFYCILSFTSYLVNRFSNRFFNKDYRCDFMKNFTNWFTKISFEFHREATEKERKRKSRIFIQSSHDSTFESVWEVESLAHIFCEHRDNLYLSCFSNFCKAISFTLVFVKKIFPEITFTQICW